MNIFALSDLHLSFGVPDKNMDIFGECWHEHYHKIRDNWLATVGYDDVVIVSGDISWGLTIDQALPDLDWIDQLPGTKIIVKGNHDYWWQSRSALEDRLPESIIPLHNNSVIIEDYLFFGSRLWEPQGSPVVLKGVDEDAKLLHRELARLKLSVQSFPKGHEQLRKIGVSHFPPSIGAGEKSEALDVFKSAGATDVVFGHLHGLEKSAGQYGEYQGVQLHLTSCDYLQFKPLKIV